MKSKIIKSKQLEDGIMEIIEYQDDFGDVVSYSVINVTHGKNITGGGVGEMKENIFPNKKEAITFFNNQY